MIPILSSAWLDIGRFDSCKNLLYGKMFPLPFRCIGALFVAWSWNGRCSWTEETWDRNCGKSWLRSILWSRLGVSWVPCHDYWARHMHSLACVVVWVFLTSWYTIDVVHWFGNSYWPGLPKEIYQGHSVTTLGCVRVVSCRVFPFMKVLMHFLCYAYFVGYGTIVLRWQLIIKCAASEVLVRLWFA